MLALWNQFDELFNDDAYRARRHQQTHQPHAFALPVDIVETEKGYELTADIPGLSAEQVDITIEDGVLTLKGERKNESSQEGKGYRRVERTFGKFQRSFTLPKGVQAEDVVAQVDNGQLKITVPKPVSVLPRKVKVQTNAEQAKA